ILLHVEPARPALPHPAEHPAHPAVLPQAAEEPDVQAEEEEGGEEAEEEAKPGVAPIDRLGTDLDALLDQQLLQTGVQEGGERRGEMRHGTARRRRRRVPRGRVQDRLAEAARQTLAAVVDLLDVAPDDLFLEQRVRNLDRLVGTREEGPDQQDVRKEDQEEAEPRASRRERSRRLAAARIARAARGLVRRPVPVPWRGRFRRRHLFCPPLVTGSARSARSHWYTRHQYTRSVIPGQGRGPAPSRPDRPRCRVPPPRTVTPISH